MSRKLVLEDGTVLIGEAFGGKQEIIGEIVFNTSMSGYQEIISDPSNYGQMITFSYPMIGNYGINRDDFESIQPVVKAVIVKEACEFPSNWRSNMSLNEFLTLKNIPGISGIDTRMLTRIIRDKGTMKAAICSVEEDTEAIILRLKATTFPKDEVKQVTVPKPYPSPGWGKNIVVIDFGLKHSILRELTKRGCNVTVVPYSTPAEEIITLRPDGVLLSNGPGNPAHIEEVCTMIQTIQELFPVFGIGLGHQLLAMANGCNVIKMRAGNRSGSIPVKDLRSGKVLFTSQNHGYEVDRNTVDTSVLEVTHEALNGQMIEGLQHKKLLAMSVQFEPEAAPGSGDAKYIFDHFLNLIDKERVNGNA